MKCKLGGKNREHIGHGCWVLILVSTLSGCARSTYHYGLTNRSEPKPTLDSVNPLVFGGEHPKLDRLERRLHYPIDKIKRWFPRRDANVEPQELRRQATYKAQEYLVLNELSDVNIDVREYDPATQWQRLKENDRIHPFWKYTSGTLAHLKYAWLPGRVFHYDDYNPYTNTLYVNSTSPATAVHQAAEAKIIRNKKLQGTYLAAQYLPIVPLIHDVRVANDVLSYARVRQEWEFEKQLTPSIYASFGADAVSQATSLVPGAAYMPFYYKPLLSLAGSAAGGVTGRAVVKQREVQQRVLSELNGFQSGEGAASDLSLPAP